MTPEIAEHLHDALHEYAALADGNLDALLGHTVTSPWLPFAWTALVVITVLAAAALIVTVWKERRVGGAGNEIRAQRAANTTRNSVTRATAEQRRGGVFTITPADDTDDLPDPPVNLDAKDGDR